MPTLDTDKRIEQRKAQLAEAYRRLPGPGYYKVLRWIHEALEPTHYLEIGIRKGVSLRMALDDTRCIGVDPEPQVKPGVVPEAEIFALTSDDFFEQNDLTELLGGPVELAFIDGLHHFEQVLRDFVNVERHATSASVALLHDCIPFDEVTSRRERVMDFYSGDVWKAALVLRRLRPELEMITVRTAPTGLCIVRGLDPENRVLDERWEEMLVDYRDLGFDYYSAHRDEMPAEIPSDEDAVRDWLQRKPVDVG